MAAPRAAQGVDLATEHMIRLGDAAEVLRLSRGRKQSFPTEPDRDAIAAFENVLKYACA